MSYSVLGYLFKLILMFVNRAIANLSGAPWGDAFYGSSSWVCILNTSALSSPMNESNKLQCLFPESLPIPVKSNILLKGY
jgi:hypothetical protein